MVVAEIPPYFFGDKICCDIPRKVGDSVRLPFFGNVSLVNVLHFTVQAFSNVFSPLIIVSESWEVILV